MYSTQHVTSTQLSTSRVLNTPMSNQKGGLNRTIERENDIKDRALVSAEIDCDTED